MTAASDLPSISSTTILSSDNITLSAHQEQDIKTRAQIEKIENEIKANQKLTSDLIPITELSNLYLDNNATTSTTIGGGDGGGGGGGGGGGVNKGFLQGCEYLATKYTNYRAIRGDGNCYYRAFLYALVENLYNSNNDPSSSSSSSELKRISDYINNSIDVVVQRGGYDRFAIETFHEEMVDLLSTITEEKDKKNTTDDDDSDSFSKIHNNLNEENGTSDYCVWYLRVITSTILKSDPDRFVHYLNDGSGSGSGSDDPTSSSSNSSFNTYYTDVPTYCAREIDPMGKECSMVGVLALAEAFQITVEIEYMDGKELDINNNNNNNSNTLIKHSFGGRLHKEGGKDGASDGDNVKSSSALCITLLYRPGHYDILYK